MTNGEKYAGETHNHYVFERMCPRCSCSMCPREPSELRQCLIADVRDYKQWLLQDVDITENCYGGIARKKRTFLKDEWADIKKKGFYWS